jgi:cellulose synthase/poly-beta-1,6-N-acetylglucosamine synthase-like glycosyltransferase
MRWSALLFLSAAILLSVPVGVVCVECLAWLLPKRRSRLSRGAQNLPERDPLVVLIPAHDEESHLAETLRGVKPQLRSDDQILLVADNCADRTAEIAREEGVEVIERLAPLQRGKGHALSFGVEHLKRTKRMPRVTIVIDADCTVEPGAIEALAARVIAIGRPVQAIYLLDQPAGSRTWRSLFSEMAFLVRNGIRPGGTNRLGLPCLLTGSGMAFPWHVLSAAKLSSGNLVEDMRFGINLALAGCPAAFCEEARVVGRLSGDERAARTERTPWQHGHLMTVLTQVPRLISVGFRKRKLAPVTLAMDLCVPSLAVLAKLILVTIVASGVAAIFARGSWRPTEVLLCGTALLFLSLTIGCAKFGRASLPAASLWALLTDIWRKTSNVVSFISRQMARIRISRSAIPVESAAEITADGASPANEADTMPLIQTTVPAERSPERLAG